MADAAEKEADGHNDGPDPERERCDPRRSDESGSPTQPDRYDYETEQRTVRMGEAKHLASDVVEKIRRNPKRDQPFEQQPERHPDRDTGETLKH
jgi:hypothetical protein